MANAVALLAEGVEGEEELGVVVAEGAEGAILAFFGCRVFEDGSGDLSGATLLYAACFHLRGG